MSILTDRRGNILLSFDQVEESHLQSISDDVPLTHALIVVRYRNKYLLGFNVWRKQWEIFGGYIEADETPRQAVLRELNEEAGIQIADAQFLGMTKIQLKPENQLEYGAIFGVDLKVLPPVRLCYEILGIILWDKTTDIGPISEIDAYCLDYLP